MRKRELIAIILIVAFVMIFFCSCSQKQSISDALEKEIINAALADIDIAADTPCELKFIQREFSKWSEWEYWVYELKVNGEKYSVGVQRNDVEIHYVDVEGKI